MRATDEGTGYVFVELENASDAPVKLKGAEAEFSRTAELVGFRLRDGEQVYEPLPFVPITAGGRIELQPFGLAIQLSGLQHSLDEGDEIEIELEFDTGHMDVHVQVEAANATQHRHAGHQHE